MSVIYGWGPDVAMTRDFLPSTKIFRRHLSSWKRLTPINTNFYFLTILDRFFDFIFLFPIRILHIVWHQNNYPPIKHIINRIRQPLCHTAHFSCRIDFIFTFHVASRAYLRITERTATVHRSLRRSTHSERFGVMFKAVVNYQTGQPIRYVH